MSSNYLEVPKLFLQNDKLKNSNHFHRSQGKSSSPEDSDSLSSSLGASIPEDNSGGSVSCGVERNHEETAHSEHWLDRAITPLIPKEEEAKPLQNNSLSLDIGKDQSDGNFDYKEAALIIWNGESNAKFYRHPTTKWSKRAYAVLNNPFYHLLHFGVCNILLLLALAELPSVEEDFITMDLYLKYLLPTLSAVELACLSFLLVHVFLHILWLKRMFFRHRIAVVLVILVEMYIEVLVILILAQSHMRLDRALRPILLLDAYYMSGVRRIIRQTFEIFSHIIDVVFLLIFFILVMALIGYILFGFLDPGFFLTYSRSFLSLFVTSTTANDPTVMLEAYARFDPTPLFFVVYFVLTLYFAANTLLAVVYSSYSEAVRKKFKKLFFHKRDALYQVFQELNQDGVIEFHDFLLVMHKYKPRMPEWQVMCIFKALHRDRNKQHHDLGLTLEEFMHFYDILGFKWTQVNDEFYELKWYSNLSSDCLRNFIEGIDYLVSLRLYKFIMGVIVLVNMSFLIICLDNIPDPQQRIEKIHQILPGTFVFLSVYIMDILFSVIAEGFINYYSKLWNVADSIVIGVSLICALLNYFVYSGALVAFVVPVKLFRLVKIKRSYRDLLDTLIEVSPRLFSFFLFIVILYYSYSIIGMEFLFHRVHQGCCKDALFSVGKYYQGAIFPPNISLNQTENVYYIENFNNILRSYVTLFYEMIVNNWYIIMEGFASTIRPEVRWWGRVYFIVFYLTTLVMLQMLIALMVDAFVCKMQAREAGRRDPETYELKRNICYPDSVGSSCSKNVFCCPQSGTLCPQEKVEVKKTVKVTLEKEDLELLAFETAFLNNYQKGFSFSKAIRKWRQRYFQLSEGDTEVKFIGTRSYTDIDVHRLQYEEDIKEWIKEYYKDESRRESSMKMQPLCDKKRLYDFCHGLCNFILG